MDSITVISLNRFFLNRDREAAAETLRAAEAAEAAREAVKTEFARRKERYIINNSSVLLIVVGPL